MRVLSVGLVGMALVGASGCSRGIGRSNLDPGGWYAVETIYVTSPDSNPQRGVTLHNGLPTLDPRWYSPPLDESTKPYGPPYYVTAVGTSDPELRKAARNNLQAAMMGISEDAFDDHIAAAFATQDTSNILLGLTALGFTTAGAAGASSQLMSALAAGVLGAKATFNEEVYAEHLAQTISNAIRQDRAKLREQLALKRSLCVTEYPVEAAIADAKEFHRRGSFYHGLELLLEGAQQQARANKEDAETMASPEFREFQRQRRDAATRGAGAGNGAGGAAADPQATTRPLQPGAMREIEPGRPGGD